MGRVFVAVTDYDWYRKLRQIPDVDEVNFWQPSGGRRFGAIGVGEMFLFKLHAPYNVIIGGGFFARHTTLPLHLAWEFFGLKNGASSEEEMVVRVARYVDSLKGVSALQRSKHPIGCVLLEQPFFFPETEWIPQPADWARNIVQGRGYDLAEATGQSLLTSVSERLAGESVVLLDEATGRYGAPTLVRHRLGQGSFRAAVTDAYHRQCAVTGDRVLYVLDAAHIRPFARGGEHSVNNGLLLRSDLHTLFDRGYLAVDPQHRVQVSRRLREEFDNGREYYALEGRRLLLPAERVDLPDSGLLAWHRHEVFVAA
ncbi:MAG: HNH endonuclease [Candidatus Dormibacteria bacterium]